MTWRDTLRPKSILLDAVVIGGVVLGANLLFDRAHPGWTNLNPSPYLLLPLLLGGRYGFTVGLLSGVAASALVLGQLRLAGAYSVGRVLADSVYLHAGFIFAGGLAGELFGWFRRERAQTEAQSAQLQKSVRSLDSEVNYLRGVKDELDRLVAARDGEVSALDTELRRLYATGADDLPAAVLQFLRRQVRLSDAALYTVGAQPGGALQRIAFIGRSTQLPATLARDASALVRLALDRGSLVTLPELLQQSEPAANEPVLLAAPLMDASGHLRALLVVTGMPFISFTAQTANLIELVCGWAGEVLDLAAGAAGRYRVIEGRETQRIFTRRHFEHLLQLALVAYQRHRLPSTVVIFSLPGAPASEQARFERAIVNTVRAGDYAAELGRPEPHLAVLLPLVGERGAEIFIERSQQFLRGNGPWPVAVAVRRVEFGQANHVNDVLAEIDGGAGVKPVKR